MTNDRQNRRSFDEGTFTVQSDAHLHGEIMGHLGEASLLKPLGTGGGLFHSKIFHDQPYSGERNSPMKHIFSSADSGQVAFIRSVLDASNIECEVRNQAVSQVMAATTAFAEEIWVRDEDYAEASEIVAASRAT